MSKPLPYEEWRIETLRLLTQPHLTRRTLRHLRKEALTTYKTYGYSALEDILSHPNTSTRSVKRLIRPHKGAADDPITETKYHHACINAVAASALGKKRGQTPLGAYHYAVSRLRHNGTDLIHKATCINVRDAHPEVLHELAAEFLPERNEAIARASLKELTVRRQIRYANQRSLFSRFKEWTYGEYSLHMVATHPNTAAPTLTIIWQAAAEYTANPYVSEYTEPATLAAVHVLRHPACPLDIVHEACHHPSEAISAEAIRHPGVDELYAINCWLQR